MSKQVEQTTAPVDVQGREYKVGDKVARASKFLQVDGLHVVIVAVTRLENGKVYIDGSTRPVKFPERMAILG